MRASCATQLNNTHTIITGGDNCPQCVFMFDWTKKEWLKVANTIHGRDGHSCLTLPNGEIMVANNNHVEGGPMKSVEIYNPKDNYWRPGVETPEEWCCGKMVLTMQNEPLIVTGYSPSYGYEDRLFVLSNGEWQMLEMKLKTRRAYAFAQMVPITTLPNCKKRT